MVLTQVSASPAATNGVANGNSKSDTNGVRLKSGENAVKVLTLQTTNPHILGFRAMEYAARGPVIMRAIELEQELELAKKNGMQTKFSEIIKMNLGDAHAMGQKPITFVRQVLALISCPELMELSGFNEDVKRKARDILSSCRGGSAGSYSDSRGMHIIRKHVAKYIEQRDGGIPSNPDDIILSAGASEGIRACLKLLKSGEIVDEKSYTNGSIGKRSYNSKKKAGVLIPVPEYPLYSATLEEYNMKKVPYYLDEHADGWDVNVQELETIVENVRKDGNCDPRAVVIINPGNPTGHVLSRDNIEAIIRFAYNQRLLILADEVYQDNVYGAKKFLSFKKVLSEIAAPYNSTELISVHSCSKGFVCECGLRAGYFEVSNMDPDVKSVLTASVAANLCPTVLGQVSLASMLLSSCKNKHT
ncbi:unnamed protein product [Orchesella dallaii]|uniref:alanine transaminase n=1 Tax=Orchesella dallaii TaxID=48710 RepID=A0ABP1PLL7_9HEXA